MSEGSEMFKNINCKPAAPNPSQIYHIKQSAFMVNASVQQRVFGEPGTLQPQADLPLAFSFFFSSSARARHIVSRTKAKTVQAE